MYDDKYRVRFKTIPAASHGEEIKSSDKDVLFTQFHNHKDFEILIIKKGKAVFTVDGKDFEANEGDVVLINPYEIHSSVALCDFLPLSFFCITFDLSLLASSPIHPAHTLCEKMKEGLVKFETVIKNGEVSTLVSECENIFREEKKGWEYLISANIFRVFGILIKGNLFYENTALSKNKIFTLNVQKYIEENFCESITSFDAAKYLSYDNSYFCRLFKNNFGKSFGDYLSFYRINVAKEHLVLGESVAKSAMAAGFNNLSYFTKVFKKYEGIIPSQYVKNLTVTVN